MLVAPALFLLKGRLLALKIFGSDENDYDGSSNLLGIQTWNVGDPAAFTCFDPFLTNIHGILKGKAS